MIIVFAWFFLFFVVFAGYFYIDFGTEAVRSPKFYSVGGRAIWLTALLLLLGLARDPATTGPTSTIYAYIFGIFDSYITAIIILFFYNKFFRNKKKKSA